MMKRNILLLLPIAVMALCACDENGFQKDNSDAPQITLSLKTDGAEVITRAATEDGDDEYNENLIENMHWYLFDSSDEWLADGTQTINKTSTATVSLSSISAEDFAAIFPAGVTSVKVFVVVNVTGAPAGESGKTLDDIKEAIELTLSSHGPQDSFAMCGEGTISKTSNILASTSTAIELTRIASKFRIHLAIKNVYKNTIDNSEWTPECAYLTMLFKKLEPKGNAASIDAQSTALNDLEYKISERDFEKESDGNATDDPQVWKLSDPVYSYPRTWTHEDTDFPYFYITLPWSEVGGTRTENSYYKVLFPTSSFESNKLYDITINLDGVGSLVPETSVTIDDMSLIISGKWKDAIDEVDKNNTDASMSVPHVLAINSNEFTIYNQESIEIPFISSHDCDIEKVTTPSSSPAGFPKFQNSHGGKDEVGDDDIEVKTSISPTDDNYIYVDNENKKIIFNHKLTVMKEDNNDYDYRIFVQTYKLVHHTNGSVFEYVTIIQKPALCVSKEEFSSTDALPTIFVDGNSHPGDVTGSDTYRVLSTKKSSGTLTRVSASVLPTKGKLKDYVLGEVRSTDNDFGNNNPFKNGYDVKVRRDNSITEAFINNSVNGRRLSYYYKAREDAADIIAPEFIIASELPGVHGHYMNYEQAELRCATFQEEGYPAGRWRLPTHAEMEYIFRLQLDNKIDKIFDESNHAPYPCSDGRFYKTKDDNKSIDEYSQSGTTVGSVRCVYDSWYWDQLPEHPEYNETDKSNITVRDFENYRRLPKAWWKTFAWGDKEK